MPRFATGQGLSYGGSAVGNMGSGGGGAGGSQTSSSYMTISRSGPR